MNHSILHALATPEAENGEWSPEVARELEIAMECESPVDWAAALDSGGGPSLALGAERRLRRGAI